MTCFKCNSTEELSAKKVDRQGNIVFICKPCRRAESRAYRYQRSVRSNESNAFDTEAWTDMVMKKHRQLADKYRPCDAFLASRGRL